MVEGHSRIMAMYSQGTSPLLVQPAPYAFTHHLYPSHQPYASAANNALQGTYSSNPQSSRLTPNAPPIFMVAPRPINRPSGSKGKPSENKIDVDKARWDPIFITYTKLFPKLMEAYCSTIYSTSSATI